MTSTAFYRSSIGRKILVAFAGLGLLLFVTFHMLGNFAVFRGPDALNAYAALLQSTPLIWVARLGILAIFGVHIWNGLLLAAENRRARTDAYKHFQPEKSTLASRSMALTGVTVLAFVIYHLLHFTFGLVQPDAAHLVDAQGRHDVYSMVIAGFRHPLIAGSYVVAIGLLGLHLLHGASSAFQTLGLRGGRLEPWLDLGLKIVVAALVIGNISMPVLILARVVGPSVAGGGV